MMNNTNTELERMDFLMRYTTMMLEGIKQSDLTNEQMLDLLYQQYMKAIALLEIRSHATWYLKGIKNSSYLRSEICKAKSIEELLNLIDVFEKEKPYL